MTETRKYFTELRVQVSSRLSVSHTFIQSDVRSRPLLDIRNN